MQLKFSKMHGLGNDFMVIDGINQSVNLSAEQIRKLSDRHFGVGFDQLLLVEKPQNPDVDFRYRIFNADGGEVEQCGNGARCFAQFVRDQGLSDKKIIPVETNTGVISLEIQDNNQVTVNMGAPIFEPAKVPFIADEYADRYTLTVEGKPVGLGVVSMGNPHAVMRVNDLENAAVNELGPLIQYHERFPNRVNVGFMEVVNDKHIRLRVYERGAGETLACGTGACAAVAVGIRWGVLASDVRVDLKGGSLQISWQGGDTPVMMTGPAEFVFEGRIAL